MKESELIERIAAAVADHVKPVIPIEHRLWDMRIISEFFQRSLPVARQTIACLPSFPKAIRLPTGGHAQPLYNAIEVIEWANKHREKN